jgi:ribose-phosphate pyrophosphokinase
MYDKRLLFIFPPYEHLRAEFEKKYHCERGSFYIGRFPNKELHLLLQTSPLNCSCLIIGSIAPPESGLFSFLILSHTLKKEGAKKVSAFIPYLAYSRQDKAEKGKSQLASLIQRLLKVSGVDEVTTIDIHSPISGVGSLSSAPLFIKEIKSLDWAPFTLVAPDQGAIERCKDVLLGLKGPIEMAWLSKTRHSKGVFHNQIHGMVQKRVIIIDDILDTGQTLISCCQMLREQGVQEMIIMVTHGLFTGSLWKKLWKLGVKKIYCTDTVPLSKEIAQEENICIIPTKKFLGENVWKN